MKKILFGVALCMGALTASSAVPYTVNAKVAGLPAGTKVAITELVHGTHPDIATAEVTPDGSFTFTGEVDGPRSVLMYVPDGIGSYPFMLGDGTPITVTGTANPQPSDDGRTAYNFELTTTGSPLTDQFYKLYQAKIEVGKQHDAFEAKYADKIQKRVEGVPASEISGYDEVAKAESEWFANMEKSLTQVWTDNKDTFWGPLMVYAFTSYTTPDQREYWESMSQEAKDSYYGKRLRSDLWPLESLGNVADAQLFGDGGKPITIGELAKGHKYLLVDFWASWCRPCRKEIPNIKNIYAANKDKGLQVVSISIDKEPEAWQKVSKIENLPWPSFLDDGTLAQRFHVQAVPLLLIFDEQGNLVSDGKRGEELAAQIAALLQ